jgi:hypothetical protein
LRINHETSPKKLTSLYYSGLIVICKLCDKDFMHAYWFFVHTLHLIFPQKAFVAV